LRGKETFAEGRFFPVFLLLFFSLFLSSLSLFLFLSLPLSFSLSFFLALSPNNNRVLYLCLCPPSGPLVFVTIFVSHLFVSLPSLVFLYISPRLVLVFSCCGPYLVFGLLPWSWSFLAFDLVCLGSCCRHFH
jgi:hypothetical protein